MCRFESGLGHQYNQRLTCCLPHNLPSYLIFLVHWLWSIRQRQAWLPYRNGATCSGGLASDATVTHPDQDLHDQDPRGGLGSAGRVRNGPGHVRLTRRGRGHDLGRSPGALCSGDNPTQKFSAAKREPGRIKVLGGACPSPAAPLVSTHGADIAAFIQGQAHQPQGLASRRAGERHTPGLGPPPHTSSTRRTRPGAGGH